MNPPYGRVKLAPAERKRFEALVYGHANLYGLFMGHHANHLSPGGVLAALVPTSFTSGAYFQNLRHFLATTTPMREVAFVSNRSGVFSDVLQETCLATFTKNPGRTLSVAHIKGSKAYIATTAPASAEHPWLMARVPADANAATLASALPLTVADAGWKASTGPLVWNRRKNDLHDTAGPGRVRIVWAADIATGQLAQHDSRDSLRYLALTQTSDQKVMVLDKPAILAQRTTAPEQARRLVSTALTTVALKKAGGRVVVENHINVMRPNVDKPLVSPRLLSRLLASGHLDRVMRCLSGSVAVSAFELEALPLPDAETLKGWEKLTAKQLRSELDRAYGPMP
jgi:adenine-specific DNA-methyltransferase